MLGFGKREEDRERDDSRNRNIALRAAYHYVWPFKVWKAIAAQKWVVPVVLVQQLIHISTGYLFPTAQEYLEKQGLDPAIASELADKEIRVRERNLAGQLHSLNSFPTIAGVIFNGMLLSQKYQAWANPSLYMGQCHVMAPPQSSAREVIATFTNIPESKIENTGISEKEIKHFVLFHEFRHCASGNHLSEAGSIKESDEFAEADSDSFGVWMSAKVNQNPEVIKVAIYMRAMNTFRDHDTALYIDAKRNGQPLPSTQQMIEAHEDAFGLAHAYLRNKIPGILEDQLRDYVVLTDAFRHVLKDHAAIMSPLAKRRAELFVEASLYFAPSQATGTGPEVLYAPTIFPLS